MKNNKIQKTTIGNKQVILDPTLHDFEKLNKKWGIAEGDALIANFRDEFCIDAIWIAMKRKRFFKPFITKRRMRKKMKPWDLDRIAVMVDWVYSGKIFSEEELAAEVKRYKNEIIKATENFKRQLADKAAEDVLKTVSQTRDNTVESIKKNS